MSWVGRRTLVTGAGGFIGSHLLEQLVAAGADVTAFVRYTSQRDLGMLRFVPSDLRDEIEVVAGDLRDPEAITRVAHGADSVFHLGALIAIPYSYLHPTEVAQVNVMGTVNVLNAARAAGVRRFVHTSTSETYGTSITGSINEDHSLQPQSPYSASKIGADALAHSYWTSFDLPVATLRPFNTYGPRQSGRAVIPTIIGQALAGGPVRLGSLTPTRDFTFVTDTAAAFIAIADCDDAVGRVLNAGSGQEISIGDLAQRILTRMELDLEVLSTEERERPETSEVFRLLSDSTLAKDLLGWQPTVSLDDGLDSVIEFLDSNPGFTDSEQYEI